MITRRYDIFVAKQSYQKDSPPRVQLEGGMDNSCKRTATFRGAGGGSFWGLRSRSGEKVQLVEEGLDKGITVLVEQFCIHAPVRAPCRPKLQEPQSFDVLKTPQVVRSPSLQIPHGHNQFCWRSIDTSTQQTAQNDSEKTSELSTLNFAPNSKVTQAQGHLSALQRHPNRGFASGSWPESISAAHSGP